MNVKSYYDETASHDWDKTSRSRLENTLTLLPRLDSDSDVLDVGCLAGGIEKQITETGARITAIDISQKAIDDTKEFLSDSYCFNVEDDVWPPLLMKKRFDVIVASEIVEHLFDPRAFLIKLSSLLKPGGTMIVTTPNFMFWKNRLNMPEYFNYNRGRRLEGHIRFFTPTTAKGLFDDSGLNVMKENHLYPNLDHRRLGWLGPIFPQFFARQMLFLVTKQKDS